MTDERKEILLAWIKKLNAQFTPYAKFSLITEFKDEDQQEDDIYISLKPQYEEADRHFYHITDKDKLTKELFNGIVDLADKQLRRKASVNEDYIPSELIMRNWKKKKNNTVVAEYVNNNKVIEIYSNKKNNGVYVENYLMAVYDMNNLKILDKSTFTTTKEMQILLAKYMTQYN